MLSTYFNKTDHPDLEDISLVAKIHLLKEHTLQWSPYKIKRRTTGFTRKCYEEFRYTTGWLNRFKLRNNFVFWKVCGESAQSNVAVIDKWKATKLPALIVKSVQ